MSAPRNAAPGTGTVEKSRLKIDAPNAPERRLSAGLKRRNFIKRGVLFLPTILIPRLIRAQAVQTADGLAAFARNATGGGGGGSGTSYANVGGTGARGSIITLTWSSGLNGGTFAKLVDGDTTTNGQAFFQNVSLTSATFLRFDFGSGKSAVIDEAKFYQQNSTAQGTWRWQGSNDASSWTNIGGTFALGGTPTETITTLSGNTTGYRYYQINGISGSGNAGPWIYEFEFKISGL